MQIWPSGVCGDPANLLMKVPGSICLFFLSLAGIYSDEVILNDSSSFSGQVISENQVEVRFSVTRAHLSHRRISEIILSTSPTPADSSRNYALVKLSSGSEVKCRVQKMTNGDITVFNHKFLPDGTVIKAAEVSSVTSIPYSEILLVGNAVISGQIIRRNANFTDVENASGKLTFSLAEIQSLKKAVNKSSIESSPALSIEVMYLHTLGPFRNALPGGFMLRIRHESLLDDFFQIQPRANSFAPGVSAAVSLARFSHQSNMLNSLGLLFGTSWHLAIQGSDRSLVRLGLAAGPAYEKAESSKTVETGVTLVTTFDMSYHYRWQNISISAGTSYFILGNRGTAFHGLGAGLGCDYFF